MGSPGTMSFGLHDRLGPKLDRRTFLVAGGVGFCGFDILGLLGRSSLAAQSPARVNMPRGKPARSTILIWLSGGVSHIDTWDLKPHAPAEYRGPFQPIATSAPGIHFCEHLPHLAGQAHH